MQIKVKMHRLDRNDNIKAIGSVMLGEITVKNFTLMKNSKDELFLVMPNRDTGRKDKDGNRIYEEMAHPVTKEMRDALNKAAIESYTEDHPVFLKDNEESRLLIEAEAFDVPYYNRVGKGQILINDEFVIKDIFINKGKDDGMYITMPNYRMPNKDRNGKAVFREIITMNSELKKKVSDAIINEYNLDLESKKQNRFSIQSRLKEAKKRSEETRSEVRTRQKEAVL